MREINIRELTRGINARRGNVSVTSPSSMPPSELLDLAAFQEDAFQEDAFQVS